MAARVPVPDEGTSEEAPAGEVQAGSTSPAPPRSESGQSEGSSRLPWARSDPWSEGRQRTTQVRAPALEEEFAHFLQWRQATAQGNGNMGLQPGLYGGANQGLWQAARDEQERTTAGPPPEWDGSSIEFKDYKIKARIWLKTTRTPAHARGPLLLKNLTKGPWEDLKFLANDDAWMSDPDNGNKLINLMDTREFYGEEKRESMLSACARITFHLRRQKGEAARAFMTRWDSAERKIREHDVRLPQEYLGFLMVNALQLDSEKTKLLLNYTKGSLQVADVKEWLRVHETDLDMSNIGNDRKKTSINYLADPEDPKEIQLIDVAESDEIDENDITDLLLTTMADLEEPDENPSDMVTLTESETKDILLTMVKDFKGKGRNYSSALKAKKNRDLARGFGAGRDGLLRPGTYEVSISELKKRTKCNSCGVTGHWARECPNRTKRGDSTNKSENYKPKSKEVNFLTQEFTGFAESEFFYLEADANASSSNCPAADDYQPGSASRDYMVRPIPFPCFHMTTIFDDHGCATIDTGCQRMAIGLNTLNKLQESQPANLPITFCNETHQFRSVHRVSCTTRLACIPCSLGPRGCILRPALFEDDNSSDAPFLLSLPFLLHCQAILQLNESKGLSLVSQKFGFKVDCHLGPTGALRIPIQQFSESMVKFLRNQIGNNRDEYELMQTMTERSSNDASGEATAMQLLPVVDLSTTSPRPPEGPQHGVLHQAPPGIVPASENHPTGDQRIECQGEVPGLRQADHRREDCCWTAHATEQEASGRSPEQQGVPRLPDVAPGPRADSTEPVVRIKDSTRSLLVSEPGVQDLKPGLQRHIFGCLKRAETCWLEIHKLICQTSENHLDQTCKLIRNSLQLQQPYMKHLADLYLLQPKQLKTVAELCNPERFIPHTDYFGLRSGQAFDLELGWNLLDIKQQNSVLEYIKTEKPGLTVISPPCIKFSMLLNLSLPKWCGNPQKFDQHMRELRDAKKLLKFCAKVCQLCRSLGLSFLFEHPWSASSWNEPCMQPLISADDCFLARGDQCMFGLSTTHDEPMRKRSGFLTNNQLIAQTLNVTCDNSHVHQHVMGRDRGASINRSRLAQKYPMKLVYAILGAFAASIGLPSELLYVVDGQDNLTVENNLEINLLLAGEQVHHSGPQLRDDDISQGPDKVCPEDPHSECRVQDLLAVEEEESEERDEPEAQDPVPEKENFPGSHPLSLEALVKRAHDGLGHPGRDRFLRILANSKASQKVMDIAKRLKCSVCEKFKLPKPSRAGAPPREVGLNELVGIDSIQVRAPFSNKTKYCLNIVDYCSHFQLIVPLGGHTAHEARVGYRLWLKIFGPPRKLLCDLGREFQKEFETLAEADGTELLPSALETPEQRGFVERQGQLFKEMFYKTLDQVQCDDWPSWYQTLDLVCFTKNRLSSRGGFSPAQRVFGYQQRIPGALMSEGGGDLAVQSLASIGDTAVAKAMEIRKAASCAFHEIDCQQAVRAAATHGPRPHYAYETGQAVYFWRRGTDAARKPPIYFWHGPARVVATQLPTTVWLSYNHHLVKAAPEKLRPASEEEFFSLSGWLEGISNAKRQFETEAIKGVIDLTKEQDAPPPVDDQDYWRQQGDFWIRVHVQPRKMLYQPDDAEPDLPFFTAQIKPWRKSKMILPGGLEVPAAVPSDEIDNYIAPESPATTEAMDSGSNAEEVPPPPGLRPEEIPVPPSEDGEHKRPHDLVSQGGSEWEDLPVPKRSRLELLEIYSTELANKSAQRQKKGKESTFRDFVGKDAERLQRAIHKEFNNNLATGAYELLDPVTSALIRKTAPDKIMKSRYVLTKKPIEDFAVEDALSADEVLDSSPSDQPCKAKCRHVMQGYSEAALLELETSTPQVHRDSVIFAAQLMASMRWTPGFADFTQAFHSGDPIDRELYAEQPVEGLPGAARGQLIKLLKTCYGLTDGPYQWFKHIVKFLCDDLHYRQSVVDPCLFFLDSIPDKDGKSHVEGVIALATDDLFHAGSERHAAKMEEIRSRYKLGKFTWGSGRFVGKEISQQSDGSILLDQKFYTEARVQPIPLSRDRKRRKFSVCNPDEIEQLRALVGVLSWLSKETRCDLAGKTALLQQSFPKPLVRDLLAANQLAKEALEHKSIGIRAMPIPLDRLRAGVVTDASWGNSKEFGTYLEQGSSDWWEETPSTWIRHHVGGRRIAFHPAACPDGPDLHDLREGRETEMKIDGRTSMIRDEWTTSDSLRTLASQSWTGSTTFYKQDKDQVLDSKHIHAGFDQLNKLYSQGGEIVIFYDQKLPESQSPQNVSVASWKSYRLKRQTVNTLSSETQALVRGLGSVHWYRILILEARGLQLSAREWHREVSRLPFICITDSKSLYDAVSKYTNPASQCGDKRTSIDISLIKQEVNDLNGKIRWIDGRTMIADPLTKETRSDLLRHVLTTGQWAILEEGSALQRKLLERTSQNEIHFIF
eukprot:s299_g19.t1